MAKPQIQRCLWLDPSHMPDSCPEWGNNEVMCDSDGHTVLFNYFLPTMDSVTLIFALEMEPEWLRPIFRHGYDNNCLLIVFSPVGETVDGLPVYNWETS